MQSNMLSFIRAARGPVQLIVLGLVFLLAYNRVAGISKTWPVLLITYGLMRLLEWTFQRGQPVPEPWQG